jgi:Ca-activated chloride channel family protein
MNRKFLLLFSSAVLLLAFIISAFTNENSGYIKRNFFDTTTLPAFAMAKGHKGVSVVNTNGFITFTSGLDNDYYQTDSFNRTGYLYIEARMARFVNESARKTPLNISIVIDRSGSMAGDKMEFAKKAAKDIIDKLSADDFLSIVIYDEYIDVLQTAVPVVYKDSIKSKIDKVKPRGSTNLWGGSEKGYEQVKTNYKKNYINRVLLISDGLANAGTTNPQRIKAKVQEYKDIEGITISTFGVGLGYNEILMTDMAENGAGNYYFINNADEMATMFDKELSGLMNVVAQNAELRITLPSGVTVEKVYPFKYEQQGSDVVIKYRDLFSEESKGVMLRFKLDDYANMELKFTSKLVYNDIVDGKQKTISNINKLNPVKSIDAYMTYFNKPVIEQVVLFTANENMEKAMLEADKGNYEAARSYTISNLSLINSLGDSTNRSEELKRMNTLNGGYDFEMRNARLISKDSMGRVQKSNRADNYKIRNKKN